VRVAAFEDLDARTAYLLWQLRESVFVVEQGCAYAELDGRDLEPGTRHVWAAAEHGPIGYLRLLDEGDHARIGRVLVARAHRGRGVSDALMRTALDLVGDRPSRLSAQSPLAAWYAGYGYVPDGEEFLDDGIRHLPMLRPADTA
jgi:ElaA protein